MKKLIVCEKPSVAMSIANVLNINRKNDGYLESENYIITWCFGHLAELANADSYDERYAKWRREDLPIIPTSFKYKVPKDKYQQFKVVKQLMNREDVETVINACDAGREGELIFRNVYAITECEKPIKRLWISSMEDSVIENGFVNLQDGEKYNRLYAAAQCREWADWIVGINATRLFSVLYHRTLNAGRVVSPTLAMLVRREAEITSFKAESFYTVNLDFEGFTAVGKRLISKTEAESLANGCKSAIVKNVRHNEKRENSPLLYDLTTLQRDANKELGYTAQQTLDYVQSLYEKKLITYPRTDSRYLNDEMLDSVSDISEYCADISETDLKCSQDFTKICNSAKVRDHHAIIPTANAGKYDIDSLPVGEREILRLISHQLLIAIGEPYIYDETTVEIECAGEVFTAKGKTVIAYGWRAHILKEENDKILPEIAQGQELSVKSATVKEGKTTPPEHFTEDSLLGFMETAGEENMPSDAERRGLGTPATRAGIIEKLISSGFIERKKAKKVTSLIPISAGVSLTAVLPEQLRSAYLTAEWESKLKAVENGELEADEFMSEICLMINELVRDYKPVTGSEILFPSGRKVITKCPRCGGDITESKNGYFCESNECRFGLWRDNKFLTSKRITLTSDMAQILIENGEYAVKNIFSERTGKSYDAVLTLSDDGEKMSYGLDFSRGDVK